MAMNIRRLAIVTAVSVATLVAIAAGGAAVLFRTDAGRQALAALVERAASGPGVGIAIGRLEGALPSELAVSDVVVSDRDGAWLRIGRARLVWAPLALLRGRLDVDVAEVWDAALDRMPVSGEPAPADGASPSFPSSAHLGRATIHRLNLGEAVVGEAMALRAEARLDATPAGIRLDARADQIDREGHFEAAADVSPGAVLTIRAALREPQGGLLSRLLGLTDQPAISIDLDGRGTVGDWKGTLDAKAGETARLRADIGLDIRGPWTLAAEGRLEIADLVTATPLSPLLGRPVGFGMNARWDGDVRRLEIERLAVNGDSFTAEGWGLADLAAGTVTADLTASIPDGKVLTPLIAPANLSGGIDASLHAEGALAAPRITFDVGADGVAAVDASADHLRAKGTLTFERGDKPIRLTLGSAGMRLPGAMLQELLGESPGVEASAILAADGLRLTEMMLTGIGGRFMVSGDIGFGGSLHLAGQASLTDAGVVVPGLGGPASIEAVLSRGAGEDLLTGTVSGEILPLRLDVPAAHDLIGDRLSFAADLNWNPDGALKVENAAIDGKMLALSGTAAFHESFSRIEARLQLAASNLAPLSKSLGIPIGGAANLSATVSGPLADPAVTAILAAPAPLVSGIRFQALRADVRAASLASGARGQVAIEAGTPWGALRTSTGFTVMNGERVDLRKLALALGDHLRAQGDAVVPFAGSPVTGSLSLEESRLGAWSELAGMALDGSAKVRIDFKAAGKVQGVDASLEAGGTASGVRFGTLKARVAATDPLGKLGGDLAVTAVDVVRDDLRIATVTVEAKGGLEGGTAGVRARGTQGVAPVIIQASGRFERIRDAFKIQLASLNGEYARLPFKLEQPLAISTVGGLAFEGLNLSVGNGRLRGRGVFGDAVDLHLDAAGLPVAPLLAAASGQVGSGTLDAAVRLSGSAKAPEGSFELALADFKSGTLPQAVALRLLGTVHGGTLAAELRGSAGKSLAADGNIRLPIMIAAWPPSAGVADEAKLEAQIRARGSIGAMAEMLLPSDQRLSGDLDLRATFGGTWGAPSINGQARLLSGEYEDFETGTILRDLAILLESDGQRMVLRNASASDGGGGRITATGEVELSAHRKFPIRARAEIVKATLVRRDDMTAIASGQAELSGSAAEPRLKAALTVDNAEVRLAGAAVPQAAKLDVIEINGAAREPADEPAADSGGEAWAMALDVGVNLPRQVFVRGRGLESEWQGNLAVKGSTARPEVVGELHPVRGDFTLAGRRFVLQEGAILFEGGDKIDPRTDLSAVYSASDLKVTVRAEGRASDPKITLSSSPVLPQDEVIARVLFGKSAGKLSAVEGIQLAQAVTTLSGKAGPAGGILDFVRGTLGLDRVTVGGSEGTNAPALQVGKYLTDRVYVGVEQAAGPAGTEAQVEVEITPSIKLESDIGPRTGGNVGLKWSFDY